MKVDLVFGLAAALLVSAAFLPERVIAAPAVVELVRDSDQVPGGDGWFSTFQRETHGNPGGTVLFAAELFGATSGDQAIYTIDLAGNLIEVARQGDSLPGAAGSEGFDTFRASSCDLNSHGQIVFFGIGNSSTRGFYRWNPTTRLASKLLVDGDSITGGEVVSNETPSLNDFAQFVVRSAYAGSRHAIYRDDGIFPISTVVIGESDTIYPRFVSRPALSEAGYIAYSAQLTGGSTRYELYRTDAAGIGRTLLAFEGGAVPEGDGVFGAIASSTRPGVHILPGGEVVFTASLTGTSQAGATGRGLYLANFAGVLTNLAREGHSLPGGGGVYGDRFEGVAANANQIVFSANLGSDQDQFGIFRHEVGGGTTMMVRTGEARPSGDGFFKILNVLDLNTAGQVLFREGTLSNAGAPDALYLSDSGNNRSKVVGVGDSINGRIVAEIEGSELTSSGLVPLWLKFLDGGEGIYLYVPDVALSYSVPVDGLWDAPENWTPRVLPGAGHDVTINPPTGAVVDGPLHSVELNTLTIDGTGPLPPQLALSSSGTIAATSGITIDHGMVGGSGSLVGSVFADTRSRIAPAGPMAIGDATSASGFIGSGRIDVGGGFLSLRDADGADFGGTLEIAGGELEANLNLNGILSGHGRVSGTILNLFGGRIEGAADHRLVIGGAVSNFATMRCFGGELRCEALVSNPTDGLFGAGRIEARDALLNFIDLNNTSTVAFSFGTSDVTGHVLNGAGGRFIISGRSEVTFWGEFEHRGADFRIGEGSTAVFLDAVSGPGSFTGSGTAYFESGYQPGASPATVSFGGDVAFGAGSELEIELGGRQAGDEHDRIEALGTVRLDGGALRVSLIGGFVPEVGDLFGIMDAAGIAGTFGVIELPLLPAGRYWDTRRLYLDGVLRVSVTPSSFTDWLEVWGLESGEGDSDGDGLPDVLEYLLVSDPLRPEAREWRIRPVVSGGELGVEVRLPHPAPADARLVVETAIDLEGAWRPLATKFGDGEWQVEGGGPVDTEPGDPGWQRTLMLVPDPGERRFFRISGGVRP